MESRLRVPRQFGVRSARWSSGADARPDRIVVALAADQPDQFDVRMAGEQPDQLATDVPGRPDDPDPDPARPARRVDATRRAGANAAWLRAGASSVVVTVE